jgi:hypothetical protein
MLTMHLAGLYADTMFRPDRMFRKSAHALARQVDIDIDMWDFFDVGSLWERQEKMAGTGMAVTVAGMVGGRVFGGVGWLDGALGAAKVMGTNNLRRLIIPGLIAGGKCLSGLSQVDCSTNRSSSHHRCVLHPHLCSQITASST